MQCVHWSWNSMCQGCHQTWYGNGYWLLCVDISMYSNKRIKEIRRTKRSNQTCRKVYSLSEMIGQAVHEATSEAIMINIRYLHNNYINYAVRRYIRILVATLKGARPCIPPQPMMPIPNAPPSILLMGVCSVLLIYASPLNGKTRLLLAAIAWDRYLGEPPLRFHPVCLAGSAISLSLSYTPDRVCKSSVLGFACGLALLVSMLCVFVSGAWIFMNVAQYFLTQSFAVAMTTATTTMTMKQQPRSRQFSIWLHGYSNFSY